MADPPRARMAGRAGSYASHAQARPQLTVWYSGPAARAPELPIEILLTELKAAADRKRNPYWYSPGSPTPALAVNSARTHTV